MLQFILDDLPNLSMPTGESHFIVPLYNNQSDFPNINTPEGMHHLLQTINDFNPIFLYGDLHGLKFDVARLTEEFLSEGRSCVRDVVAGIFEHDARGRGKPRWGDKTPYYALHLDMLVDWWPDAKIIHLIRDGRDVALSLIGRRHDFSVYNVYTAAQYWSKYVDTCRAQGARLPSNQYLELRYEDVLNNKQNALQTVCEFIGEPYPSEGELENVKQTEIARQLRNVNKNNQGKWQRTMNAWQIRCFESEAGSSLEQFGYHLVSSKRRLPLPVRALYRLHNSLSIRFYRFTGRNRTKLNFVSKPAKNPTYPATS